MFVAATERNFFCPGFQHVYARDLSRCLPCVADSIRSLSLLSPSHTASVRVLLVTPSEDAVNVIMSVLKPVADGLWTTILAITQDDVSLGVFIHVGSVWLTLQPITSIFELRLFFAPRSHVS